MKVKCDFCGNMIDEGSETCPQCGAALSGVNRFAAAEPRTIEELKKWYTDHNLPPERVTRFFIGKNIKEPKAIGIYEENGDFIVYKNKASGERAVRYKGSDEAYAVNEIYQKLRSEIANQKARNNAARSSQRTYSPGTEPSYVRQKKAVNYKRRSNKAKICIICGFLIILVIAALLDKSPVRGYYRYNGTDYYYQNDSWYYYNDVYDNWHIDTTGIGEIFGDNSSDYRIYDHQGESFEDSIWYEPPGSSSSWDGDDSSWDNDYSWDSNDSWDSGGMDWDSDW